MKFTKEGVDQSVDKLQTTSSYDVTINFTSTHDRKSNMIERVMHTVKAIYVLDAFCGCYTVI